MVDQHVVIPAEKIAELNLQTTLYKEQLVEIQSCRAPLSRGELYQRRDLRTCPFHGLIIPRDDEGRPLNQKPSKDEKTHDLGTDIVEQLAEHVVKNVREKDKELARKRKIDKKSLKRAKLAKIREHNEAVLHDVAMASTSRSADIGEDWVATKGENRSSRNKKKTFTSMLPGVSELDGLDSKQELANVEKDKVLVRWSAIGGKQRMTKAPRRKIQ